MRFFRMRFSVRRMMGVVAILALVLGVSAEVDPVRNASVTNFEGLAAVHGQLEAFSRQLEQSVYRHGADRRICRRADQGIKRKYEPIRFA